MAQQFPPPRDLSGLTEQQKMGIGAQMYQMIMNQNASNPQQPIGMRPQAMPQRQMRSLANRMFSGNANRQFQGGTGSLLNRPGRQRGIPGAWSMNTLEDYGNFSPFAQSVMQGRMGRRPMQAAPPRQMPPRQMPPRQMPRRLPPPQSMRRFSPQAPTTAMRQNPFANPSIYQPLGHGFQAQQAPLMAFNPYQGII